MAAPELNVIPCGTCGSPGAARIRRYESPVDDTTYHLFHCGGCDVQFWHPRRLDPAIYENESASNAYGAYHQPLGRPELPVWVLPFFDDFPAERLQNRTLLDVGCGDGTFLAAVTAAGARAQGIDIDRRSIAVAARRAGGNATVCTVADFAGDARRDGRTFDIISCFEVLEHQDDPRGFMADVRSLLAEAGYLVGSVPNRERFLASLDRCGNTDDVPPHHFVWWSKRSLRGFLEREGFVEVAISARASALSNPLFISRWFQNRLMNLLLSTRPSGQASPGEARPFSSTNWNLVKRVADVGLLPVALATWPLFKWLPEGLYFVARRSSAQRT